jgi:hypothetical protein
MNTPPVPRRRLASGPLRGLLLIASLPLVFGAFVWVASILSESNRIPYEIASRSSTTAVMFCTEGKIVHEDASWYERLVDAGSFRCTAWRSRGGETDSATGAVHWPTSPRR